MKDQEERMKKVDEQRHMLEEDLPRQCPPSSCPHVVIVGAGFGGLQAVRALRHAPVQITVIDRHNYHLFQPLLYQVATADLSPADIAAPIRNIFRKQRQTSVILDEVTGVDLQAQQVLLSDQSERKAGVVSV